MPSQLCNIWTSMTADQKRALSALVGSTYSTMSQYAHEHICASPPRANVIARELRRLGYEKAEPDWCWSLDLQG